MHLDSPPERLGEAPRGGWWWLALGVVAVIGIALAAQLLTPARVGLLNDDGVYATSARALASGNGYVHPFDPAQGPANRYPIGYPLLLAAIARLVPDLEAQLLAMQLFSLACLGAFLVASGWLVVRHLKVAPRVGVAIAALLAVHPWILRFGSQVMADLPFAAGSVLAFSRFGTLLEAEERRPAPWITLGLALGSLVLVRYQGFALPLALGLFLLVSGRWLAAAWLGLGALGPLVLWAGWLMSHAVTYAEASRSALLMSAMTPLERLAAWMTSLRFLALKVLPGFCFPPLAPPTSADPLVQHPGIFELALGLPLAGLVLAGIAQVAGRRRQDLPMAAVWYVGISLALILVWNTSFTFLGYSQAVRLALPLAPLLIYFAFTRAQTLSFAKARMAALSAIALGVATGLALHVQNLDHPLVPRERAAAYMRAFDYVRANTPAETHVGSFLPAMVYLYTGRRGAPFPLTEPQAFAAAVRAEDLRYIFLLHGLYGYMTDGRDPIDTFLNGVTTSHPGALTRVYRDDAAGMDLWRVDPTKLP